MFDLFLSTYLLSTDILSIIMQKGSKGWRQKIHPNTSTPPLLRKVNTKGLGAAKGQHVRHVSSKL